MTGLYGNYSYNVADREPSPELLKDMRAEAKRVTEEIASRGMGKVTRVRVEIDFADGSEIAHEATS